MQEVCERGCHLSPCSPPVTQLPWRKPGRQGQKSAPVTMESINPWRDSEDSVLGWGRVAEDSDCVRISREETGKHDRSRDFGMSFVRLEGLEEKNELFLAGR